MTTATSSGPTVLSRPVVSPTVLSRPVVSRPVVSRPVVSRPVVSRPVVSRRDLPRPDPPSPPLLAAFNVHKRYGDGDVAVHALVDLDLQIRAGELVAVVGPSGSGKTTLVNCLSGLDGIDGGQVLFGGRDLFAMGAAQRTEHRARLMGFVFRSFNLIPVFTAVENVEVALLLVGVPAREARDRAREMLARVGLGHRACHLPHQMSGGEQRRVTIARALVARPAIVWADEPTANLESHTAAQIIELLHRINEQHGQTIVLVTSDDGIGRSVRRLVALRHGRVDGDRPG